MEINRDDLIRTLLVIPLIGITSFYAGIISVPVPVVDTTSIIHVEKVEPQKISWASFYDYSLPGALNYSETHATAASREYPRGTKLKITGVDTGESVIVKINDYGPESCEKSNNYHGAGSAGSCVEREIDLSSYAYKQICSIPKGLCKVIINKK